ncbi:MAG: hypothetical protein C0621_05595 [Desulfuromonas sp.]|nr:MAG: hypothetical protein C0621_05595 [Desulfuromonas sp.]
MDMSKYRGMFLSETAEHLKKMSALLLALENDPADRDGIDALFREAHSIKGMAASMGYDRTAELAHHLEDLMDGFRQSGVVPPEAVDRLLAGTDLLEGLLEDISAERDEREIADFLTSPAPSKKEVEGTSVSVEPLPEKADDEQPEIEAEASEESSSEIVASGRLQLVIELAEDAAAPAARALIMLREIGRMGTVLNSRPGEEQLRKGEAARKIEITLQSDRSADEVRASLLVMADVERVGFAAPVAEPRARRREDGSRTVRVRTELLDQFINLTGELITNRYMLQTSVREESWQETRAGLDRLSRLVTDLHHHVLQVRMMPLESVTGRLPRVVRDLARKCGKEVNFCHEVADIELDRAILEHLSDPLTHMVRNAVDHGIESQGEVSVSAWREKDLVVVEVGDDGRGMDVESIRQKAIEKGLLSPVQARGLREREVLQLVCHPGFSTAAQVTETSGRGVGMDVVKAEVEALGGTLDIITSPGEGTRIQLKLPVSVAIIQILLVECDGKTLGIPITRVQRALEIERSEVRSSGRQMVVPLDHEMVPLISLNKVLKLPTHATGETVPVVVTEFRGRRLGLVVDRFAGQREAFVKTLASPLDRLSGVSGATILGDGSLIFILDPQALLDGGPGRATNRLVGEDA